MPTRPRVYLAGPDVFRPDAAEHFALMAAVCERLGLEALSPFDASINAGTSPHTIYAKNMELLRSAQGVVANLAPFRGAEPDSGTVFEVGVASALGLPVVGYGAKGVGVILVSAATLAPTAEDALQVMAGRLKS
ncbi:nucleoside 2-deoxyribosyltransferase [Variovorax boronicumulans]|uniref:nucleoside 2-deoxyribosyltransferase n=1 Tax=Variovorax boronicumulans TaxID=436515 RepID=UPI00277D74DD|nr:nucleoside 2-deoxyribosyltransferase [Variovorax boronicumulans]MDQ0082960.1 nucleoside 2-deoxyribosyltransferase [Variovorax boronicumulans]